MNVTLAVFAKAPVPGQVKTRLCPPLRPAEAAALFAAFVSDTVRKALGIAAPTLYFSGDRLVLERALDLQPSAWRPQGAGDLGARMARVPAPCLIVGTDTPHLPPPVLAQALVLLAEKDVVLGPAEDGGYYLIGLRAPQPRLFADIAWSTGEVLAQTTERAADLGLTTGLLPPWYDVDTPNDLRRLGADLAAAVPDGPDDCPATRRVLKQLGRLGS